ncbi:Phosphate regulon sensor protein PhoR (SphS) [Minicystis rosea]|nr:Phosphate regulon sensor protein PhoR (SphS) [Minicystis rosea]
MAEGRARRPPLLLPPQIAPVRSLRIKVFLVVAAVAMAPQLFVAMWSLLEQNLAGEMAARVAYAAGEASKRLASRDVSDAAAAPEIAAIARQSGVRLRVIAEGRTWIDVDEDQGTDLIHRIGTLFFGSDGAPSLADFDETLGPVAARPEIAAAEASGASADCRRSPGGKLLVCHGARAVPGSKGARVIVYAQESSRRAARTLYDLRYQLARLSIVTLPLALGLAYFLGRRVVKPLETLQRQALAQAGGGPSGVGTSPLAVRGQDEITDLAAALNTLLAKLAHRQGENERFVADLVHELKNPVAAVRAAAEGLAGGPVDEARARRLGKVLLDSSARLDALVSQFLELARAEAGLASEERTEVDLGALARGLVDSMRARFEAVDFEVVIEGDVRVFGVAHGIDTMLRNLVENAASFAIPQGEAQARVLVEAIGGDVQVTARVTDSGPGIPPEDIDRVFTRFFTTRGRTRGTGLGLALVRATAEAHGGAVRVTAEPGQGATFEVALPRKPRTNDAIALSD